jgi:hypothetical protein
VKQKIISTWVYLDGEDEKSKYPNNSVKADSASPEFQAIYWRCVVVFFATSLRFHKDVRHILFTNTENIPTVDGMNISDFFAKNGVEIIVVRNKYPLPNGYYSSFRNQFFEFSIIESIAEKIGSEDGFLMLDSDCIFSKSTEDIFQKLKLEESAITYAVGPSKDYKINGVTGTDMQELFEVFKFPVKFQPIYSGGEVLFCKGKFLKSVTNDFPPLYKELLNRFEKGMIKFNEEAHVLSFFYYKYGASIGKLDSYIKRMWTNHNYFRNVVTEDEERTIWHLPNEKGGGFEKMFNDIKNGEFTFSSEFDYKTYCKAMMLDPKNHKVSYYKRMKKRVASVLKKVGVLEG